MSQQAALFLFLLYILWLFAKELRRRQGISWALWGVTFWVMLIGSRPVSTWFSFGGTNSYDEGNPFERMVYFVLIFQGLITLGRRQVRFSNVVSSNKWLFVFCAFWAASVVWSDEPFITLKRFVKDMGNLVMVLVVLTEDDPIEAVKAVFVRCACLLVPMSMLLIRFFGELGRAYHIWSGEMMYTGVTTHKNSLGVLVLVCGLFLMWDLLGRWQRTVGKRDWVGVMNDGSLLLLTLMLLLMARSSSSLACMALGVALYFVLGMSVVRKRARNLAVYCVVGGAMLWVLNSVVDLTRIVVVDILGRDLTLTTRTEVWPVLIAESDGMLLGSGFNSFWTGARLSMLGEQYGIIQAHNGYLETYLNGGFLGVALLLVFLLAAAGNIKNKLAMGSDFARVRFMVLAVAVVYNFTEAFYNKQSILWFATLLVVMEYPWRQRVAAAVRVGPGTSKHETRPCPASS